eukprot:jgi/Psemu1/8343/gm1.8343_g
MKRKTRMGEQNNTIPPVDADADVATATTAATTARTPPSAAKNVILGTVNVPAVVPQTPVTLTTAQGTIQHCRCHSVQPSSLFLKYSSLSSMTYDTEMNNKITFKATVHKDNNQGALILAKLEPGRHTWIRAKQIHLEFIKTHKQKADFLSKPLGPKPLAANQGESELVIRKLNRINQSSLSLKKGFLRSQKHEETGNDTGAAGHELIPLASPEWHIMEFHVAPQTTRYDW